MAAASPIRKQMTVKMTVSNDLVNHDFREYIDPERLKDNDSYKEYVRSEMVRYGEEIRSKDPEIFCRFSNPYHNADSDRMY